MSRVNKLPKAVQAAKEASDLAMAQWKAQREGSGPPVVSGESTPETIDPPVVETPTEPQAAVPATPEVGGDDGKGEGLALDWKAEATAMKAERDKSTAQFQTLQGKYNAEVPRMSEELRNLRLEIVELKAAPAAVTPEAVPAFSGDLEERVTKLKDLYGEDIADVISIAVSQATGQTGATVDSLRKELEPRLSRVDAIEANSAIAARATMFDAVAAKHSDWEEINDMATFHTFLAEKQPGTSGTRQEAIDIAVGLGDPEPIIHQLTQFKRRVKRGNSAMDSQVVPGDTGRTEPAPTDDTNIYPLADVKRHQVDMARTIASGKPYSDEQNRLEGIYDRALRERRVR